MVFPVVHGVCTDGAHPEHAGGNGAHGIIICLPGTMQVHEEVMSVSVSPPVLLSMPFKIFLLFSSAFTFSNPWATVNGISDIHAA